MAHPAVSNQEGSSSMAGWVFRRHLDSRIARYSHWLSGDLVIIGHLGHPIPPHILLHPTALMDIMGGRKEVDVCIDVVMGYLRMRICASENTKGMIFAEKVGPMWPVKLYHYREHTCFDFFSSFFFSCMSACMHTLYVCEPKWEVSKKVAFKVANKYPACNVKHLPINPRGMLNETKLQSLSPVWGLTSRRQDL